MAIHRDNKVVLISEKKGGAKVKMRCWREKTKVSPTPSIFAISVSLFSDKNITLSRYLEPSERSSWPASSDRGNRGPYSTLCGSHPGRGR